MLQFLLVCSIELADDLIRGNVLPPNASLAEAHARQVAAFEAAHGLLLEPRLQHALSPALGTPADTCYAVLHLLVFALVMVWVYIVHRPQFAQFRAMAVTATIMSVGIYEAYPTAPPRLAGDLTISGRHVRLIDTASGLIGGGKLHLGGWAIGYNPYSAMPSLHIVWATLAAGAVILLGRGSLLRLAAGLYPIVMLATVIITGNHFILDAAAGAAVTIAAVGLVTGWAGVKDQVWVRIRRRTGQRYRMRPPPPEQRTA